MGFFRSSYYGRRRNSEFLLKLGIFLIVLSILSMFILPMFEIQNLDEDFITAILITSTVVCFILAAMLNLIDKVELPFTKLMIVAGTVLGVCLLLTNFTSFSLVTEYAEIIDLIVKGCIGVITAWIIFIVYKKLFTR